MSHNRAIFATIFSVSFILPPNQGSSYSLTPLPKCIKNAATQSWARRILKSKCANKSQSRGQVCGKHRLSSKLFLFASMLPELHVPFTSQSHNLESKPFDELHEFVTGLSVIRTKPVSVLFFFLAPAEAMS